MVPPVTHGTKETQPGQFPPMSFNFTCKIFPPSMPLNSLPVLSRDDAWGLPTIVRSKIQLSSAPHVIPSSDSFYSAYDTVRTETLGETCFFLRHQRFLAKNQLFIDRAPRKRNPFRFAFESRRYASCTIPEQNSPRQNVAGA